MQIESNPFRTPQTAQAGTQPQPRSRSILSAFDKFCAAMAFVLGDILFILGVVGLFAGSSAHFTLPPVLGALPALIGWGILRPIIVAWKTQREVDV